MDLIIKWLSENYIEILGAILGIAYVILSIKQNIFTWPVGLLTSALYVWIFFESSLYAEMGLQLYYVFISIYGWLNWIRKTDNGNTKSLQVSNINLKLAGKLVLISVIIFILIWYVLDNYTDSQVPVMDSAVTSLSIVATWMLAKKILEHWIIWIITDILSIGLFLFKGLMPTVFLFIVYTTMAFLGYIEWKKDLLIKKEVST